jgi:hypothetical protein
MAVRTVSTRCKTWAVIMAKKRSSLLAKLEYTAPLVRPAADAT